LTDSQYKKNGVISKTNVSDMLSFTVEFTGLQEVLAQLDATKDVLTDLQPEMAEIGAYLVDFFTNDVFETEGDVIGESWADLSEKYNRQKIKQYPGRGTLERTGTLRHGFQAIPEAMACVLLNPTPYGIFHELGTSKMPARVFMKFDEERVSIIRDMILESVNQRVKDAIG
jgi:phage gpG-like protein